MSAEKRVRTPSIRLGHEPETFGTCELYVGAPVVAPFKGSAKLWPGTVETADFESGTVAVSFDDGDHDAAVKVASIRFQKGAQAKLPRKRDNTAGQKLKMKPKAVRLRLPAQPRQPTGVPRAAGVERDWTMHKVISVKILPPRAGEGHYDNVDARFTISYQWLWADEVHPDGGHFPADRIGTIALREVLDADAFVCGMYLVALRHFCMDAARSAPVSAIAAAHMFGAYDPIEH